MTKADFRQKLAKSSAIAIAMLFSTSVLAQERNYNIPAEPLGKALRDFGRVSGQQLIFSEKDVGKHITAPLKGVFSPQFALQRLLADSGLVAVTTPTRAIMITPAPRSNVAEVKVRAASLQLAQATSAYRPPSAAPAPAPAEPEPEPAESREDILVSGSRIVRDGYQAPTPVTVVGLAEIQTSASSNVADFVNTLPALAGSMTPQSSTISIALGTSGVNGLNLRNLGLTRTLVLVDGQRAVGSLLTGVVDINTIPQQLVQRVDIVTGGASAAYGSDALAGVVNFVLDKKFKGFKAEASSGITTYGDNPDAQFALTYGAPFAGGRGHILLSGEYAKSWGIEGRTKHRDWISSGHAIVNNPAYGTGAGQSTGVPQLLVRDEVGTGSFIPGGIITTAGPLRGVAFGPGGTPFNFNYGDINSPPLIVGGDWELTNHRDSGDLMQNIARYNLFGRVSYELTDDIEIYGQVQYGNSVAKNRANKRADQGTLVIQADNAFIPASVRARVQQLGLSRFTIGTLNPDLPSTSQENERTVERYVGGVSGNLDVLGSPWKWDAYYQYGVSRNLERVPFAVAAQPFLNAVDAVTGPSGAIVCRSTLTNPTDGCRPYNVFGIGVNGPNPYLYPGEPFRRQTLKQSVMAATISGEPFSLWAGPVSFAIGAEHRRESVSGSADALSLAGGWFSGNLRPTEGKYSVSEAFIETAVPVLRDSAVGSLDFNGAVRATDYSVSGYVTTWKAGLIYNPIEDIRIRVTRSRDIRAPNLSDLYLGGDALTSTFRNPFRGGANDPFTALNLGNPRLTPEKADTLGLGIVLHPRFLPGFDASVDYFNIKTRDAITAVPFQTVVDYCFEGVTQYCSQVIRDAGGAITQIQVLPQNVAKQITRGLDIEAGYNFDASNISEKLDGNISVRVLATHYIKNYLDTTITPPTDDAGSANLPGWVYRATVNYSTPSIRLSLTARGTNAMTIDNSFVTCLASCPVATTANPTIDDNKVAAAFFLDSNITYTFLKQGNQKLEGFFSVSNLLNADPPLVAARSFAFNNIPTNPRLWSPLGRMFRVGLRLAM